VDSVSPHPEKLKKQQLNFDFDLREEENGREREIKGE
jgi:hypothetical protein